MNELLYWLLQGKGVNKEGIRDREFCGVNISSMNKVMYISDHLLQNDIYCLQICFRKIDGSILEQVKQCNYLGCELSLDGETDIDKKKCKEIRNNMWHN